MSGHPDLPTWTPEKNLGFIVNGIIREFIRSPPRLLDTKSESGGGHPTPTPPPKPAAVVEETGGTHTPLPPVPSSFAVLERMTTQELQALLSDPEGMKKVLLELPEIKEMDSLLKSLRDSNEQAVLANVNANSSIGKKMVRSVLVPFRGMPS